MRAEQKIFRGGTGDDLLEIENPSENTVLDVLKKRFSRRRIYTKIGNLLTALNPNEHLPIYDSSVVDQYRFESDNEAHIFTSAEQAYLGVREGSTGQNIILSGESGSGKTHNAIASLRFLAQISSGRKRITPETIDSLHTVLRSFVSAKTMKNDSSTRIGYAVELLYKTSQLEGLSIKGVLPLEAMRIVSRPSGERNFNVLHEIVAGLTEEERASYGVKDDHKFFYLSGDSKDECKDKFNFERLVSALESLGFTEDQRHFIFSVLSAVLHLGNVYYSTKKDVQTNTDYVTISNEGELKWIALLLGVDHKKWAPLFVEKKTKSDDDSTSQSLTVEQALDVRDSLASILYEELINWLFGRISFFFKYPDHTASISVLDYYGVERYNKNNSLEQLLINTVNEGLEHFILGEIFDREKEAYAKESIKCPAEILKHASNTKTIELLIKKPFGILHLLDDECKFPKASDESFLQHCDLNHLDKTVYGKSRNKERSEFSVQHFSGTTWYAVQGFLSGNRRSMNREFIDLLCESSNVLVSTVFRSLFVTRIKEDHTQMAATVLCKSLTALLDRLRSTPGHFVRCLKTNNERLPSKFDETIVGRQIKAYSLMETLRFRSAGFPVKIPTDIFVSKYRCLLPCVVTLCQKDSEILQDILEGQGLEYQDDFQFGSSNIFLRERLFDRLKSQRKSMIDRSSVVVQKTVKAALIRRRFLRRKNAVIRIQAAHRAWKARRELIKEKEALLQSIENESKSTQTLKTYHRVTDDDILKKNDDVSKSLLGPIKYLDVDEESVHENEKKLIEQEIEVKKTQNYLPIPPDMQRPTIDPVPIETFAENHFKGHLLEARREPVQTPFLSKDNDEDFDKAVEMFKLVLRYTNDASMKKQQLHAHARRVIQMAIDNVHMRDELFVQLCNQTYNNKNKIFSERAWTLLLMAVHAFPPSILTLPMLLHYFVSQPPNLRDHLMEGLVRRIRTKDAQACRLFAANRIEHAAFSTVTNPVLQVHLHDGDEYLVEAHPWVTAEELAARVLRERGMGELEGWSVCVETEDNVFCPSSGHFFHDAIAAIESGQKLRRGEDEIDPIFHFPNARTLAATKGQRVPPVPEPRKSLMVNGNRGKVPSPPARTVFKSEEATRVVPIKAASPDTVREDWNTQKHYIEEDDIMKSEEEELSINMNDTSSGSSDSYEKGGKPMKNEVMVDPTDPNNDYCYTLPNKNMAARRIMAGEYNYGGGGLDAVENYIYTLSPPAVHPQQGMMPMERFQQQPIGYATVGGQITLPPQPVQYIQYLPVVVSQPLITSPVFATPVVASSAHYSHPPMVASSLPAQQLYQPILSPSLHPQTTLMHEHAPLLPQLSSSSHPFGSDTEERIRSAMIRQQMTGMETPTVMSVASRIRRMPVPSKNSDVDRFLDEVFQQVLTPEENGMESMSARRIASTIKGGVRRSDFSMSASMHQHQHQSLYYEHADGYHLLESQPFNSLLPMHRDEAPYRTRVTLNRVNGSLPRRLSPNHGEQRQIQSDQVKRRYLSGGPIMQQPLYASETDYPIATFARSSQIDYPLPIGDIPSRFSFPGLIHSPQIHAMPVYGERTGEMMGVFMEVPQEISNGSLMYGETGVARYGLAPPPPPPIPSSAQTRLSVESPLAMSPQTVIVPTPAPRQQAVSPTTEIVQNSILNSEHPTPGKLINPARTYARTQIAKEREALAKLAEKQKHLPPPIEEVRVQRPKPIKPKVTLIPTVPAVVHIPEEPRETITPPSRPSPPRRQRTPSPEPPPIRVVSLPPPQPRPQPQPQPKSNARATPPVRVPADNEWVFDYEVERPKAAQNVLMERGPPQPTAVNGHNGHNAYNGQNGQNGHTGYNEHHEHKEESNGYNPPLPRDAPFLPQDGPFISPMQQAPVKERPAYYAPKQPWKLTIRKLNFLPGEQLDDIQVIDQVFSQIIDDCRRAIAYRIRAVERDNVTAILKKHQVHPDQLNRQHEIPVEVKVDVIEAARQWPLYFNQIYDVIEERATENVFVLLAVGETGLRLIIHNPENKQSPLTVQDHFEYGDIKDVTLEEKELLTIRTRSNMLIHLRSEQAVQIRSLIERYLYGSAKPRHFVLATADYVTSEVDHLSFARRDRIELVDKAGVPTGWLYGRIHNRYGVFPAEHIVPEHFDERGNHPDVPAVPISSIYSEVRDAAYGYEYAEEGEGREKFSMLEFAILYFRPPKGERRKDWPWKEVAKKIMWTDRPIQNSLLRLEGNETNKLACDAFLCVMKFMGDENLKRGESYTDVVYRLLMLLRKMDNLRDEVYCQIVRQTTNNRSESTESAARGWRLFSILTAFFVCTPVLKPYLMKHLQDVANDPRRPYHGTAELCVSNMNKTFKYGGRKMLLSGVEIEELTKGKSMKRQVYHLPGGHKKVVNTNSVTVVEEVVRDLCIELNIRSPSEQQEFVLCAVLNHRDEVIYATNDQYILDICTELEYKHQKYAFYLKRAVWLHPLRLDSALYIDAMYFQIVPDYLTGLLVSPQNTGHFSAAALDEIAVLSAYVFLAEEDRKDHPLTIDGVCRILPQTTLLSRIVTPEMWIIRIERKLRTMDTNISASHARAAFLEVVEKWPTFGAIFYRVLTNTDAQKEVAETVLCINRSGMRLLSGDNYRTLAEYKLSSIGPVKKFSRGETEYLDIPIRRTDRDLRITVQSDKASDIARLIGHYLFVYASNKRTIRAETTTNN